LQLGKLNEAGLIEVDEPATFRLGALAPLLKAGELYTEQFVIGRWCSSSQRMLTGEDHVGPQQEFPDLVEDEATRASARILRSRHRRSSPRARSGSWL
jgi:hypothetical protein